MSLRRTAPKATASEDEGGDELEPDGGGGEATPVQPE